MRKDVVGRRSKTPTWACVETHHVGLCEYRPTGIPSILRSVVEDPDNCMHANVLRKEATGLPTTSDSASTDLREYRELVGRRSKTPTWAYAETKNVGLCEYRPTV